MHPHEDDITAIQATLQGRQSAYAVLVQRYSKYVFTLVLRYVPDREVAEELAQDVFVKAYKNLSAFRGESKFSTWLYTIVHTTCLSHMRKKGSNIVLLDEDKVTAIQDHKEYVSPEEAIEAKGRQQALSGAIGNLPAQDAQLVHLFYIGAQSVEEIATITGLTVTNVKVRLFRARQKLKEIIETKYRHELLT